MPKYTCHKTVHALKIASIDRTGNPRDEDDGSRMITPADPGFAPFRVEHEFVRKHNPRPGGYYVVYEDGYKSFSPADAFEKGYTRIWA
jgi:hypothetical protein